MDEYFKELKKIEKRKISPAYLLVGNDIFMKQEFVKTLFTHSKDAEKKIFYASQGEDEELNFLDNLVSFGLFSTRKVLVYYDIDKFSSKYRDKILRYLDHTDKDTVLVLIMEKKPTVKFTKELQSKCKEIKVWTPRTNQFIEFVQQQIARMGIEATGEAINLLASITDDSLHHTFAEFEKVLINSGDGKRITSSEVKKVVGGDKKYSIWDFLDAIGNKNFYKAIDICDALTQMGMKPPYMILQLYNLFNDMYICFSEDPNKILAYNWQRKQQVVKTKKNYQSADFGKIFFLLNEADMKAKSTGLSTQELIVPLIYEILQA